jgi:hypothetical protein
VHETAQQIDASKEDGHDGDKLRNGSVHGVTMPQLGVGAMRENGSRVLGVVLLETRG